MQNHYFSRFRLLSRYQWRLSFLFLLGLLLVRDYSHGFVAIPNRPLFGVLPPTTDILTPVTRTSVTRLWSIIMMVPSNATETNLDPSRTIQEEQDRKQVDKTTYTKSSVEVQESFPNQVLDNGDVLVSAARVPGCTGILLRTVQQDLDCSNPQNQQQQYEIWFSLEGTDELSESQFPNSLSSSLELEERSIIINMQELVGALFHTYLFIEAEQELQQRQQVSPAVPIQLSRQLRVVDPPDKLEPVLKRFGFQQQSNNERVGEPWSVKGLSEMLCNTISILTKTSQIFAMLHPSAQDISSWDMSSVTDMSGDINPLLFTLLVESSNHKRVERQGGLCSMLVYVIQFSDRGKSDNL
jgi:hypothetical protein